MTSCNQPTPVTAAHSRTGPLTPVDPMALRYARACVRPGGRRPLWRASCERARWLAAASPGPAVTRFDHAMLGEVLDQGGCPCGQVFRHGFAGKLAVVFGQRRHHPAMVFYRLVRPA